MPETFRNMPERVWKGDFNGWDKHEHLPALARLIYGLTDAQDDEKMSKRIAMRLAERFLPMLRNAVAEMERE